MSGTGRLRKNLAASDEKVSLLTMLEWCELLSAKKPTCEDEVNALK